MDLRSILGVAAVAIFLPAAVSAGTACVQFDVPHTIAAEKISSAEFRAMNPGEHLVQIQVSASSLVQLGSEQTLLQCLYIIGPIAGPFQVADYSPKTTLDSDVRGDISVDTKRGKTSSAGINALLPIDFPVKGDASASVGASASDEMRYQINSPKQLVAASGTMYRGTAAYFKLKPSSQTTLEGDKIFTIVARVPDTWRGGLLQVQCLAFSKPRGLATNHDPSELVCGSRAFYVGVYLQGDQVAREAALQLAQVQRHLQEVAQSESHQINKQRFPSLGHRFAAAMSLSEPRYPERWLDAVLAEPSLPAFSQHLPKDVLTVVNQFDSARRAVLSLARAEHAPDEIGEDRSL